MKRGWYVLLALSLGLNGGLLIGQFEREPARATPPGQPPREHRRPPVDPADLARENLAGMTDHLDLTADQQVAIRAILAQTMPALAATHDRSRDANRRLGEAFAAPDFDAIIFWQRVAAASELRARVDSLAAVMLVGEASVLTPSQRERFAEVAPTIYAHPQGAPPGRRPDTGTNR